MIHPRVKSISHSLIFIFCTFLFVACKSTTGSEPDTGSLKVTISTSGVDKEPNGYFITLDSIDTTKVKNNDFFDFSGLQLGEHEVYLSGIDFNCDVAGENPRTVILENSKAGISFNLTCEEYSINNKLVIRYADSDGTLFDGLFLLNEDGTNPLEVTSDSWDRDPIISPDGTKIAYVSSSNYSSSETRNNDIYVVDASGDPMGKMTETGGDYHEYSPSWSPDSKKIVFSRTGADTGGNNLIMLNIDDGSITELTYNSYYDRDPSWSPKGNEIVFSSLNRPDSNSEEIYKLDVDGTNIVRLTNDEYHYGNPVWSPNGEMIAFLKQNSTSKIFVMKADGTGIRQLINDNGLEYSPSWSPDGDHIIFERSNDIYKVNIDGSGLVNVTNTPDKDETDPYWSPLKK